MIDETGSAPLAREQSDDYNTISIALSIARGATVGDKARQRLGEAIEALNRMDAERDELRAAVDWAYQLTGARWPNLEALDNLSAVRNGEVPPHEWPVVPPVEADHERDQLRADLAEALEALSVIAEALREPAGGSYWPARQFLDDRQKCNDDLNDLRVLYAVSAAVLSKHASRRASGEQPTGTRALPLDGSKT